MPSPWLTELATSIADGASVDWAAAEAKATDSSDRDLLTRLKVVEQITRGHSSGARPAPDTETRSTWGQFRDLELIGRGTFGDVYRARDARLDRQVALKLLRRRDADRGPEDSVVIDEARLMARVRHPHVVTVYGADRIDGRVGVWMELLEGRTLEHDVRTNGRFDPADVMSIGLDLSSALEAVHRAGLLHRDVKAQNVIRDADGRSVLTDFGSGREVSVVPAPDSQTELAGTPLYLAPEILAGAPASPQSDVYSLGVVLYYLASGAFPVRGRTLRDLRDSHDRQARIGARSAAPGLPVALAAVIDRAIEPTPAARYQSAHELHEALARVVGRPSGERHRGIWFAAAVIAAALAGTWWWARGSAPAFESETPGRDPEWRQVSAPWIDTVVAGNPEPDGRWFICVQKTTAVTGRIGRCDPASERVSVLAGLGEVVSAPGALISSDGARVAYVKPASRGTLWSSKLDGSDERALFVASASEGMCDLAAWSWQGQTVAGCVTAADGTADIVAVSPAWPEGRRWPLGRRHVGRVSLSPDHQSLVYDADAYETSRRDSDLFIVDLLSGVEQQLTSGPADDIAPTWSDDSRAIYFASDRNGSWAIGWVDAIPRLDARWTVVKELGAVGSVTAVGVGRNAIVYRLEGDPVEVHTAIVDWAAHHLETGTGRDAVTPISAASAPSWSPDGGRLAYLPFDGHQFAATGRIAIVDARAGARPASILVTSDPFRDVALRWSADGQSLVACCALGSATRAWLVDLLGPDGRRSKPLDLSLSNPVFAVTFGPSSTTLFYSTTDGVWSYDTSTGEESHIYTQASGESLGEGLELSPDGRRVAFDVRSSETHRNSIRVVPIGGGRADVLYETDQAIRFSAWSGGSTPSLVFLQSVTMVPAVWELRRLSLADRAMVTVPFPSGTVRQLRVHPDGQHIAYSAVVPAVRLWELRGGR